MPEEGEEGEGEGEEEEEEEEAEPLCRKVTARVTFDNPWSTSRRETDLASFALADDDKSPSDLIISSLAVPHTPSVTKHSRCRVSSSVSITRRKLGCLTRARAVAPARAAARAASPSSGEGVEVESTMRLSRSQTETCWRAAAEPGERFVKVGEVEEG